jgi:hypothetical protein
MNLLKSKHWLAIGLGSLSGPALAAAITCTVTPPHSIITEGQTLQLQADCNGAFSDVNWSMDGTSVTGNVTLSGHAAGHPIYYTTPVGLGDSVNPFVFTLAGTPANGSDTFAGASAEVLVKPSSAVLARAAGSETPTNPLDAACGTANGTAVTAMPTNGEQCVLAKGKPALAISGPTAFTWSCVSLTGGAEANCSAVRGYTVTFNEGTNPALGSLSSTSEPVAAGGTATVTATVGSNSVSFVSSCGGAQNGTSFTTGPVNSNCTVTANYSNSPTAAACGSANTVATLASPTTGLCATGTLLGNVANGTGQFTWTCDGPNGGMDASCTAPMQYTVTAALSGTGGTVNAPTSKTVTHNDTTSFTVTPEGTNVASASGCGASVSGNTVTTGKVTGACTVSVSFAAPSSCVLPANTTVYSAASPEPYVAVFDTLFDLATTASTLDSTIGKNSIKSYAFSNDKAFKNGSIYNFYSTAQKDMSISACPGDFNVPAECQALAQMSPRIYWSRDGVTYVHPTYSFLVYPTCNIGTGGTVYLNVRNSGTTSLSYQIRNEVLNKQ